MQCRGLVVGERVVGENGKFLDILTDELGLIEVAQKGVKSLKNENRSALQTFAYSSLYVDTSSKHYVVKSSELIESFYGMREDLSGLALAAYISQVVTYAVGQHSTDSPTVLRLVLNVFHYVSKHSRSVPQLKSIFELRFLSEVGYAPNLLVCGRCGLTLAGQVYFSVADNSAVCQECATSDDVRVSPAVFKAMQHIVYADYGRLFNFRLPDAPMRELNYVTERALLYTFGRGFSSLDYYKAISR